MSSADEAIREILAEYAHEAWSGWMRYLFEQCGDPHENMTVQMPGWAARRWMRQMDTPYAELPEEEKESDRAEADKILKLLRASDRTLERRKHAP